MKKQITEKKQRRIDRNAKIKSRYCKEMHEGGMSTAVIAGICKSYNMTVPTVYSIINEKITS